MKPDSLPAWVREWMASWGPNGAPPEGMVLELLKLLWTKAGKVLRDETRDRTTELEQVVIAYGLGWGRALGTFHSPADWDGVWDKARRWLEHHVCVAMRRTAHYLEIVLGIEGYAFGEHPDLSPVAIQRIVNWLIQGNCPCPTLFAEVAKAHPRVARCHRDHAIASWEPEACSFLNFVWQAVKGRKPRQARGWSAYSPKALVQGMQFWNLHQESHLRLANVLVWVCNKDGSTNFEGLPCRKCHEHHFDPEAFRTVLSRLVVPTCYGGRYAPAVYWNCQHCRRRTYPDYPFFPGKHYYPEELKVCPKCGLGRTRGAAQSHIYVLSPRRDLSMDTPLAEPPFAGLDGKVSDCSGRNERNADVRAVLDSLAPASGRILELRFMEQLTQTEAALEMGLKIGAAKRLEAAAKREFKAKMKISDAEYE